MDLRTVHSSLCPHQLWITEKPVLIRGNQASAKPAPQALVKDSQLLGQSGLQVRVPLPGRCFPAPSITNHPSPSLQRHSASPRNRNPVHLLRAMRMWPKEGERVAVATALQLLSGCPLHDPGVPVFLHPQNCYGGCLAPDSFLMLILQIHNKIKIKFLV